MGGPDFHFDDQRKSVLANIPFQNQNDVSCRVHWREGKVCVVGVWRYSRCWVAYRHQDADSGITEMSEWVVLDRGSDSDIAHIKLSYSILPPDVGWLPSSIFISRSLLLALSLFLLQPLSSSLTLSLSFSPSVSLSPLTPFPSLSFSIAISNPVAYKIAKQTQHPNV